MQEACGIRPCDVLAFWLAAGPDHWFTVDQAFDTEVRRRFLKLWQAAKDGELSSWEASDDGLLALAIVLDQFPRNMFRGDPRAYATDLEARTLPFARSNTGSIRASIRRYAHSSICR